MFIKTRVLLLVLLTVSFAQVTSADSDNERAVVQMDETCNVLTADTTSIFDLLTVPATDSHFVATPSRRNVSNIWCSGKIPGATDGKHIRLIGDGFSGNPGKHDVVVYDLDCGLSTLLGFAYTADWSQNFSATNKNGDSNTKLNCSFKLLSSA